jgi:hypothetical protein
MGLAFLLTGSALIFTAIVAVRVSSTLHTHKQRRLDRVHQAILTRVDYLKTTESYQDCVIEAGKIPAESLFHSSAKNLQDQCQIALDEALLNRAQMLAQAERFQEAMIELQTVSSRNASRVRQLSEEWSRRILQLAESYYIAPDANLPKAIEVANSLSPVNPLYIEAQIKIRQWRAEWASNQYSFQAAQAALQASQPEVALLHAQQINHPHWQRQSTAIVNAAYTEMTLLAQAQKGQPNLTKPAQADHANGVATPQDDAPPIHISEVPEKLLLPITLISLIFLGRRPAT